MTERAYRSTVLVSALVWFLLGLHAPMVHQITHHHRMPDTTVLVVMAVLIVAGVVSVLALLRGGRGGVAPSA
jgi:cytochrome bd-type quinol oxidase subunit 2